MPFGRACKISIAFAAGSNFRPSVTGSPLLFFYELVFFLDVFSSEVFVNKFINPELKVVKYNNFLVQLVLYYSTRSQNPPFYIWSLFCILGLLSRWMRVSAPNQH
uniref:Uncharacterized protein n=1 Tax=Cacopsylla melanoneura TaxID=428564 RepID=A0A8D8TSQ2_9HEMI